MKQETYDSINKVSKNGIGTVESHHKMKYKTSETETVACKKYTRLLDFPSDIQKQILNKIFYDQKYIIGKYNLLNNIGEVTHDQMPHRDYQQRKGQ